MAKVTDNELRSIINREINNAIGYMGSNLTSQRKKSLEYYMGDKLGTEMVFFLPPIDPFLNQIILN